MGSIADARLRCLVITGGHRDAYERVGDVIAEKTNAERAVISGAAHLVQDTGEPLNRRLEKFLLGPERPISNHK